MNKLEFRIETKTVNNRAFHTVSIHIDNEDLIDRLSIFEKPFAMKEGSPMLAGAYSGLTPETLFHNLTEDSQNGNSLEGKSNILDCECGNEGCWPLAVEIKQEDDKVIWMNFEQFYRGIADQDYWDYASFGPFVFHKKDYLKALDRLNQIAK